METILTVLITLGVVALLVSVVGVIRLKRKVEDLELDRLVFIDELATTRRDLYVELESLNVDMDKYRTTSESNLDRRFDNIWSDVHKLDAVVNPNKHLLK